MRLLALSMVVPLVACGGPTDDDVVVFAASSLTDAFDDIADAYTSSTGESVVISAAGSSDLAAQIDEGAPADVFASAEVATMDRIDGADGAARIFATNRAEIVVEPGNPHGIVTLGDLADPELLVVVCAEQVPCGAYTTEVLDRAGVDLTPVSFESNVRAVLTKVELGEADAGVVYATDIAAAAERVDGVPIADEFNVEAEYPIVALGESGEAFVDFVVGGRGASDPARARVRRTMSRDRRRVAEERLPLPVLALAVVAVAFFVLPLVGLLWRVPWSEIGDVITRQSVIDALWLSLQTSLAATVLSVVFGVPLAWLLARVDFRGRGLVRAVSTLSMVLPPVVAGVALFASFGRRGLFGQYLDEWFGIRLPFTTAGVVVAQTFVAMPFLVLTVESAIRQFDPRVEDAARTLGAGRWYVFSRVTLPGIRPALVAGAVLAWARALGEFGATITFAGNFPGTTRTMPLATFLALETDPGEAIVIALVLVAVSLAVLVGLRDRWLGGTRGLS